MLVGERITYSKLPRMLLNLQEPKSKPAFHATFDLQPHQPDTSPTSPARVSSYNECCVPRRVLWGDTTTDQESENPADDAPKDGQADYLLSLD